MAYSILLLNHVWFKPELIALGHRVATAGWSNAGFDFQFARPVRIEIILEQLANDFIPDRIVYLDDSYPVNVLGLEDIEIPSIFISVDTHHHYGWHRGFSSVFSKTFIAQRQFLPEFAGYWPESGNAPVAWLPLWATALLEPDAKSIDVCFRGTLNPQLHPKRAAFFSKLSELVSIDVAEGPYERSFPKAKIVVNQAVGGDLNFRVFEAMMCEALVITPGDKNGQQDLFTAGKDILYYEEDNVEQVAEYIRYYLQHDEERSRIAAAGRAAVLASHTAMARAKTVERAFETEKTPATAFRYLGAATAYLNAIVTLSYGSQDTAQSERPNTLLNEFFYFSIKSLLQAARCADCPERELEIFYLLCKSFLDDQRRHSEALEFSKAMAQLYPESNTFMLHYLDSLLTSGKDAEAKECAAGISASPAELLANIPKLLKDAKDQVLSAVLHAT